jgi:MoxR-like ATPase
MNQPVVPNIGPRRLPADPAAAVHRLEENIERVVQGKPQAVRLTVTTLLARGHLLIEDVPGVGKTTLARAMARSLGGSFHRIQFTSDLLPSDIVGVSIYNQENGRFEFKAGPIFANVVLADEINRTTPRTQSSLLEAMSEARVSVDERTYDLAQPFFVIATQNPQEHFGTYPLPESQMDRFLLRIRLGYPAAEDERRVITSGGDDPVEELEAVVALDEVRALQERVDSIRVEAALVDYAMNVVAESRRSPFLALGISPRGAKAWYRGAQAYALVCGRDFVVPDDFKELALPALAHRIVLTSTQDSLGRAREEAERVLADILDRVPIPI